MRLKSRIERAEERLGVGEISNPLFLISIVKPSENGPVSQGIRYARGADLPDGMTPRRDGETEEAFVARVEAMAEANRKAAQQ